MLIRIPPEEYGEKYQDHVLALYQLYVQSAENISSGRRSVHSFFLSVNTAIIAAVGYFYSGDGTYSWVISFAMSVAGIAFYIAWLLSVESYKQLNEVKFKVIHALEARLLPVALYKAEWEEIGENRKHYRPFTTNEVWIPWIFLCFYVGISIFFLYSWCCM